MGGGMESRGAERQREAGRDERGGEGEGERKREGEGGRERELIQLSLSQK